VGIAEKVARAVRQSSGGLRYVKALGMLVEGRAQVSMNLTNYSKTPVARVVEMIRREAARYAVGVHHCELVGLIPQQALVDAAQWYLQLDQFEAEQILEHKIQAATQDAAKPEPLDGAFLEALAAGSATPGGGSAAAYAGAAGAALVAMVARLTVGKKKYAAVEAQMQSIIIQADTLRSELTAGVAQDSAAYEQVMAAFKLPKDTPEQQSERAKQIQAATLAASQVPLHTAKLAVAVMALAQAVVETGNINALSDGGSAAALARAALTGAGLNVRINARELEDKVAAQALLDELATVEQKAAEIESNIQQSIEIRGGFSAR
jgi:glutamate formiminotransferase/formiminotetrahydrofolate cyclodeaminase